MSNFLSFKTVIVDKPFNTGSRTTEQTARVTFIDELEHIQNTKEYGVMPADDVYTMIQNGDDIELNNCYVGNFSLTDLRLKSDLNTMEIIEIRNLSAINTFFEADDTIDFAYSRFTGEQCSFVKSTFGVGNVSFLKCEWDDIPVDFSNSFFGRGHTNFQYAKFGNEYKNFESLINIGNLSFVNAQFGKGKVNFKSVSFGAGSVEFHFSKFDKGDVSFDKAKFEGRRVDFRRVEFGEGKLDFRRSEFNDANVHFDESEFGKGRKSFKKAIFGTGNISFEMTQFGDEAITFETAEFGQGNMSFYKAEVGEISFKSCHLNNYLDLRVQKCNTIDLSNTIVRDVIDLKTGFSDVNIKEFKINGLRNLGKIILDYNENNVESMIENQEGASNSQKAEQFRILKEDFGSTGQYEDEDKAYVKFKRYELKHLHEERLQGSTIQKITAYPLKWFQQLVFDKMGVYATDPMRVLYSMLVIYVLFSLLFYAMIHTGHGDLVPGFDPPENMTELQTSFYHSAITFLTIGYGDYAPWGVIRVISSIEGFVGLFMMSYFTVAFVRKILR